MKEGSAPAGFVYPEGIPEEFKVDVIDGIDQKGIPFTIREEPIQAYAAFDWAIPTLFFAWIGKAYFEAFLKEAGKEHYLMLKSWTSKMVGKIRVVRVQTVTSSETTEKVNPGYTQSRAVSLILQLKSGRLVKVLFDNGLNQQDWEEATERMLDLVVEHYRNAPEDAITAQTENLSPRPQSMLYATLDEQKREWTFLDDKAMFERETGRRLNV